MRRSSSRCDLLSGPWAIFFRLLGIVMSMSFPLAMRRRKYEFVKGGRVKESIHGRRFLELLLPYRFWTLNICNNVLVSANDQISMFGRASGRCPSNMFAADCTCLRVGRTSVRVKPVHCKEAREASSRQLYATLFSVSVHSCIDIGLPKLLKSVPRISSLSRTGSGRPTGPDMSMTVV